MLFRREGWGIDDYDAWSAPAARRPDRVRAAVQLAGRAGGETGAGPPGDDDGDRRRDPGDDRVNVCRTPVANSTGFATLWEPGRDG